MKDTAENLSVILFAAAFGFLLGGEMILAMISFSLCILFGVLCNLT